ncbi:MAG: thermosome subunit gamma [Methanosaeta sp. NSM2]|nr:thermosome subunit [Methanothrix sp.]MDD1738345.1 thermosome subunit [Methanothrix sp.]OYV13470.1 MAG: thermosome subunit gamma [Methanosaeta sp. ASM2]OYV14711.1 MAG: thermosome subunit gamma [Methanosaeta sp. NSM2]
MAGMGGTPIIILKDTRRESGKDAISNNIMAARAVANAVRSTMGPKGMDKLLVDSIGEVTITNDGVTILKEMDVQHPAAKMLIEAAKTQDKEVGDGTTTVAVLVGELLKKAEVLLDQKVHPTMIVQGYQMAAEKAIEIAKSMAVDVSENDQALLEKIAETAMTGKLSSEVGDSKMSKYAVELVLNALESYNGKKKFDMDRVNVEKKVGESTLDSQIIEGVVIDKEIVHQNMPRKVENARIALLSTPIESKDTETKTELQITSSTQFQQFMEQEKARIKEAADKVIASGATAVFCQKGIDDLAQHHLANAGIIALRRVIKKDLDRLARATGATIVTGLDELKPEDLGTAALVEEKRIGSGIMTFVSGTKNHSATLLLRGGTQQVLNGLERALDDALHAVADVVEDGKMVPGGGAPEIELSLRLKEYAATLKGREQLAVTKFAEALEIVPKTLAENAGYNAIDKVVDLKNHHEKNKNAGIDAYSGEVKDMLKQGVVEPLRVKIQAIQSATDAACLILRIDDVLASTKKAPERAPGGMPPGMGGMGGMGMPPGMGGMGGMPPGMF